MGIINVPTNDLTNWGNVDANAKDDYSIANGGISVASNSGAQIFYDLNISENEDVLLYIEGKIKLNEPQSAGGTNWSDWDCNTDFSDFDGAAVFGNPAAALAESNLSDYKDGAHVLVDNDFRTLWTFVTGDCPDDVSPGALAYYKITADGDPFSSIEFTSNDDQGTEIDNNVTGGGYNTTIDFFIEIRVTKTGVTVKTNGHQRIASGVFAADELTYLIISAATTDSNVSAAGYVVFTDITVHHGTDVGTPIALRQIPLHSASVTQQLGGGVATLNYRDVDYSNLSIFQAARGKGHTVETKNGKPVIFGIVEEIAYTNIGAELRVEDILHKMQRVRIGSSLYEYKSYIRKLDSISSNATKIIDKDAVGWSTDGYNNLLCSIKQTSKTRLIAHPLEDATPAWVDENEATITPANQRGDPGNLYFLLDDEAAGDEIAGNDGSPTNRLSPELFFNVSKKVGTTLSKISINVIFQSTFYNLKTKANLAQVKLYNYNTAAYVEVYDLERTDMPAGKGPATVWSTRTYLTPNYQIKKTFEDADVTGDLDDYLDAKTTNVATDEFNRYEMKLIVLSDFDATNAAEIHVKYAEIELEFTEDQESEQGVYQIDDSTSTSFTMNADQHWEDRSPILDGIGAGDLFTVTKTLEDQIVDAITAIGLTSVNINVDIEDDYRLALTDDYTNKTFKQFMDDVSRVANAVWFTDPAGQSINVISLTRLVDSTVNFTGADFVDFTAGVWRYGEIYNTVYDNVTVVGADEFHTEAVSSPDITHDFGDTTLIVSAPHLQTKKEVKEYAQLLASRLANIQHYAYFDIDLDDSAKQSYLPVKVGYLADLQLPTASDTSLANHTAGNDGQLLIEKLQYTLGQVDICRVNLRSYEA